ncbi:T9SS type B sorting domain-containing protein [Flavobacterium sp. H122]|uniref:T9SS type B sorting domain-containing protein n=1 Tax=Flavobacterium sp. H122 TaxID=2529860 RepID=UPI0010AA2BB1|nr:T9SS type B sorting domain-containing protein [Flavobacterium sp. H122]
MKKALYILLFIITNSLYSQGETNNWHFGESAAIDFNGLVPQYIYSVITSFGGSSSISDANGNILFYTNGSTVYNKNNQVMPNGQEITIFGSAAQSAIIVPKPGNPNRYYIFSNVLYFDSFFNQVNSLKYAEVDMTLDNNNGDVVYSGVLLSSNSSGRISAVKNSTGTGYWVGIIDGDTSQFKIFEITTLGINPVPVLSNTVLPQNLTPFYRGCMKFSPNGKKVIVSDYNYGTSVYDFDNSTGKITNPKQVNTTSSYGVEFSPSSNVAYVTKHSDEPTLYQYDLTAANIEASQKIIYVGHNTFFYGPVGQLQLASNGKIYFSNVSSYVVGEINDPEVLGVDCNYNPYGVIVAGETNVGLPCFVQSFLNNLITSQKYCTGSTTKLTLENPDNVLNVSWDFGDGSPTMSGLSVTHDYQAIGDYLVTATITLSSKTITKQKLIKIVSQPIIANPISDQNLCGSTSIYYDLTQFNSIVLGTQSTSEFGVKYFGSYEDAVNGFYELNATNYSLNFGTRTIYAKVYALGNPTCYAITNFDLNYTKETISATPADYTICENAPHDGIDVFDLSTLNTQILNGQNPANYTITYHTNLTDATNDISALPLNYTNTQPQETLYARVENNSNPSCYATTAVNLKVFTKPSISVISNVKLCDNVTNDGVENYMLSQKDTEIRNGQSATQFGISYYVSQTDAIANSNAITSIQTNYAIKTIYARIYNIQNPNCFETASFTIGLFKQPMANQPTEYVICESAPYNGIEQFDLASKNTEVLGNQSATDFAISYHKTLNEANTKTNSLPLQYSNSLPQETLYVRIENISNPNCFAVTNFDIKVIQSPTLSQVTDFKQCDDASNDGKASFDLNTKNAEVLNGQSSATFGVSYHYTQTEAVSSLNTITTPVNNSIQNQTIYYRIYVKSNPNCFAVGSFKLVVNILPKYNTISRQMACDDVTNDGKNTFDLYSYNYIVLGGQNANDFTVNYYFSQTDAQSGINALPQYYQNVSNPQTIYVRVDNKDNTNCYQLGTFELLVNKLPVANQINNKVQCSDGLTSSFILNDEESNLLGNQSAIDFVITYHNSLSDANAGSNNLPVNYTSTSSDQTIYVRVENKLNKSCYTTTSFHIITHQNPVLNMSDIYSICQGSTITITAPTGFDSYLWSTGETSNQVILTQDGQYSLTVTKKYGLDICDKKHSFNVYNSNIATIQDVVIKDWNENNNSIDVIVTGDGEYEYSIDGIDYQDSHFFSNLAAGNYTIFVKDKKGCGIVAKEVYLLSYPKYFTPNNDGYNDKWKIDFSENEPNLTISIFDRFGKFLKELKSNSEGWDGIYLNQPLPSNDYWFVVKRENGKEYRGHFSLKR